MDYAPQREKLKQPIIRGAFETTPQWQSRVAAQQTEADQLERGHKADREAIVRRYADEAALESAEYVRRINELKSGTYLAPGLRLSFADYDADRSLLTLRLNGDKAQFTVPPERAQVIADQLNLAHVEEGIDGRLVLVDESTGGRFAAYGLRSIAPPIGIPPPKTENGSPATFWRNTTDNELISIRVENDQLRMYDPNGVLLADLSRQHDKNPKKSDKYVGRYFFQRPGFCKGGGHIEVTGQSPRRIDGRLERPFPGAAKGNNEPDYSCSTILHSVGASVWSTFSFVAQPN